MKSRWICLALLIGLISGCAGKPSSYPNLAQSPGSKPQAVVYDHGLFSPANPPAAGAAPAYLDQVSYPASQARYFAEIQQVFDLQPAELALLQQNGLVVSDRLAFQNFTEAYAYIYWKDLPVLVTTDSILQSVHVNYDTALAQVEGALLARQLFDLLKAAYTQVIKDESAASNPLYEDLKVYLAVPLLLLADERFDGGLFPGGLLDETAPAEVKSLREAERYFTLAGEAGSLTEVNLFGDAPRQVDFTLFAPRGHYTQSAGLARYFRAMSWLAQVDFRIVAYDPGSSQPILQQEQLASAALLATVLERAGLRDDWAALDGLLSRLVGVSDNMTLDSLEAFLADAGLAEVGALLEKGNRSRLLELLTRNDYGRQRITGQILQRDPANPTPGPLPRPVSFMLFGSRFVVDSFIMSQVVYDSLVVDGRPAERPYPSPLDVFAVLGSARAVERLQPELAQWGYLPALAALQNQVSGYRPDFWYASLYNRWLNLLFPLGLATTGEEYPQSLRTAAWADKMLNTGLASWAQLRHDNILYAKQSMTMQAVCSYPVAYVEPYPAFFAAAADYGRWGEELFASLPEAAFGDIPELKDKVVSYFSALQDAAGRLKVLAEKELRLEEFTAQEAQWLKSIVKRQEDIPLVCGEPAYNQEWEGWYTDLYPQWAGETIPALIADVHTNPNNDPSSRLYPPGVLHSATGPATAMVLLVDTDEGATAYVGPVFTYFETVEQGYPPRRLADEDWWARLAGEVYPQPPAWTGTFRLPAAEPPLFLRIAP